MKIEGHMYGPPLVLYGKEIDFVIRGLRVVLEPLLAPDATHRAGVYR